MNETNKAGSADVLEVLGMARTSLGCETYSEELDDLLEKAISDVSELMAAIEERRMISAGCGKSTGIFAVSDDRIDAAIARCKAGER